MKKLKYNNFSTDTWGVHKKIINIVKQGCNVLEVGCASGYISKRLVDKGCMVWGIEINSISAKVASKYCIDTIVGDIEDHKTLEKLKRKKFNTIILADVLEHLKDPEDVLNRLTRFLEKDGIIIMSIPNIAFLTNRLSLLLGKFDYQDYGIMDKSHLRFFTKSSFRKMLHDCRLRIVSFEGVGNFTQLPLFMQTIYRVVGISNWWRRVEDRVTKLWPEGLAIQYIVICKRNGKN